MRNVARLAPHRARVLYLDARLAVAEGWIALVRRMARENHGTDLGADLQELLGDLLDEPPVLRSMLLQVGGREHRLKQRLARWAERLGRLRRNGSVLRYSPLSRLDEIEGLAAALTLRAEMWESLVQAFGPGYRVDGRDLGTVRARARRQAAWLEPHHAEAARALG